MMSSDESCNLTQQPTRPPDPDELSAVARRLACLCSEMLATVSRPKNADVSVGRLNEYWASSLSLETRLQNLCMSIGMGVPQMLAHALAADKADRSLSPVERGEAMASAQYYQACAVAALQALIAKVPLADRDNGDDVDQQMDAIARSADGYAAAMVGLYNRRVDGTYPEDTDE